MVSNFICKKALPVKVLSVKVCERFTMAKDRIYEYIGPLIHVDPVVNHQW